MAKLKKWFLQERVFYLLQEVSGNLMLMYILSSGIQIVCYYIAFCHHFW
uniref:Uncharacterized protein n=1 Tax=Rhizophora mucronata TaxID=61149 RepID=A0A2P2PJU1_RHIMU